MVQRGDDGKVELDYNMATANLLAYYCPMGLLGLGLTALLASFMSGMAGNVTAFNSVWTYDIYQSYIAPNRPDAHYLWMGRAATLFGILASIGAAYLALQFNNIMDAPIGVRLRQRPAVRHLPPGHVLEADHRPRGLLGPGAGDGDLRPLSRLDDPGSRQATTSGTRRWPPTPPA